MCRKKHSVIKDETSTELPSPPRVLRVAVGDPRRLIADALAALVEKMEGFSVASVVAAEAAPDMISPDEPDLLLVGVGPEPGEALELVQSLRERAPSALVVLLVDSLEPTLLRFALDHHVNGLLLTDTPARDIAACLNQVVHGHSVLPAGWQGVLAGYGEGAVNSLSERQLEVLRLVAEGYSYDEIAARLFISVNTVKFHVRSIYLRLGVRNRMAAARLLAEADHPSGRLTDHPSGYTGHRSG